MEVEVAGLWYEPNLIPSRSMYFMMMSKQVQIYLPPLEQAQSSIMGTVCSELPSAFGPLTRGRALLLVQSVLNSCLA